MANTTLIVKDLKKSLSAFDFDNALKSSDNEAKTRMYLVEPFFEMLRFNRGFENGNLVPEYDADFANLKGKKVDYLRANPAVWGQIAEDNGYIEGECSHAYITLQFMGDVEFQTDVETKRKALLLMIDKYEKDPEPMKKRFINETALQGVLIGKIKIQKMTGKQSPAPKKG